MVIRFIDIRNQGTGYRFAFFDTVNDWFIEIDQRMVFESYEEISSYQPQTGFQGEQKQRLLSLCPEWTKDGQEDDLEKWYGED